MPKPFPCVLSLGLFTSTVARAADTPRAIALPDFCNTPDAMAVCRDGSLILSVPNFTDPSSPGVLMRITPDDQVSRFARLPLHPQTGRVYPMGVREAPSGDLYVADCQCMDAVDNNSRLLYVRVANGKAGAVEVVAEGLNVANGVAIHQGFVYLTDSARGKTDAGAVSSAVYRFRLDERGVQILPGRDDPHLVATLATRSKDIPVGADGIDFDDQGRLYVANCGDAVVERLEFDAAGRLMRQRPITAPGQMRSADGLFFDRPTRQLYVADILANAVHRVGLDGRVTTVATSGDNDGSAGQLDAPSEVVARGQELIVANFDRVFPGCVNTRPDRPYTLAVLRKPRP